MSKLPYINRFIGDELKETLMLSLEEVGARWRIHLAMAQNDNSGIVTGSWQELSRMMGADSIDHAKDVCNRLVAKKIFCLDFATNDSGNPGPEIVRISDPNLIEKLALSLKRATAGSKGGSKKQANAIAKDKANTDIDIGNDTESDIKDKGVGKGSDFLFDIETELPVMTLESAEMNQYTVTGKNNTQFIRSQWKIFLHERMNEPPLERIKYQQLSDLTKYFINWIRTKYPKNGTQQNSSNDRGKSLGTSDARIATAREW